MTVQQIWDTSLSGIGPFTHSRSVLVVPGDATTPDEAALGELRRWGWTITVADPAADLDTLADLARRHEVALFCDIRGNRAVRRALTAYLPTVAVVPARRHGRVSTLLRETGARRDTTVLIVREPRDAKILRRLCASALVRPEAATSVADRAAALGAVLLRAHAWQPAPTAGRRHVVVA
jgi:hypothetical protein